LFDNNTFEPQQQFSQNSSLFGNNPFSDNSTTQNETTLFDNNTFEPQQQFSQNSSLFGNNPFSDNSTTQNELLNVLGRVRNIKELSEAYRDVVEEYEENENLLSFANGVWSKKEFFDQLELDKVIKDLAENYLADFQFLGSNPVSEINEWVETLTRGKIKKLVDQVPEEVDVLLTNTLYFKDAWTTPFEAIPEEVRRMFTLIDGTEVDMTSKSMYRDSNDFLLVSNLNLDGLDSSFQYTALSIPYGSLDRRFEMIIMMPEKNSGLAVLEDFLYESNAIGTSRRYKNLFDQVIENIDEARHKKLKQSIDVEMPMFTIESDIPVIEHMKKMGVKAAFNVGEFNKLTRYDKMKVSDIKHKALIEVTREGTIGVAATGVEIGVLSANFFQKTVKIDKPFLFFVRDRRSETLLFVGSIKNPISA
jgi:serpin B